VRPRFVRAARWLASVSRLSRVLRRDCVDPRRVRTVGRVVWRRHCAGRRSVLRVVRRWFMRRVRRRLRVGPRFVLAVSRWFRVKFGPSRRGRRARRFKRRMWRRSVLRSRRTSPRGRRPFRRSGRRPARVRSRWFRMRHRRPVRRRNRMLRRTRRRVAKRSHRSGEGGPGPRFRPDGLGLGSWLPSARARARAVSPA